MKLQHRLGFKHPRWANPWVQVGLVAGLLLIGIGTIWYVVLRALRHADTVSFPAEVLGLAIIALGLLLFGAVALRAFREDLAYVCPFCDEPASRWRWFGVYLVEPPPGSKVTEVLPWRKAHRRCASCVDCRRPVVVDFWPHAARERPYHRACWDARCRRLCDHPSEVAGWLAAPQLSKAEQARMLAGVIRGGSHACATAMLARRPDLDLLPLPDAPTALHTAAAAGELALLTTLAERRPGCLDVLPPSGARAHSLRITALDPGRGRNDLYVPQPPLTYNDRPVYVGHAYGHYLYYYEHQQGTAPELDDKGAPKAAPAPGWCITDYLGSGAPEYRLSIDDVVDTPVYRDSNSKQVPVPCHRQALRDHRNTGGPSLQSPRTLRQCG